MRIDLKRLWTPFPIRAREHREFGHMVKFFVKSPMLAVAVIRLDGGA